MPENAEEPKTEAADGKAGDEPNDQPKPDEATDTTKAEAKRSDESVSVTSPSAGEAHTTRLVLQLPPIDSCRMRVSTELRKGTWLTPADVSAWMTLPSASSDVLIFCASARVPASQVSKPSY